LRSPVIPRKEPFRSVALQVVPRFRKISPFAYLAILYNPSSPRLSNIYRKPAGETFLRKAMMADAERHEKVYRQTYLPNHAKCNYSIGALILKDYPDFCASIGRCIALWAHVDSEMGNLFSILLGAESDAAFEVFTLLRRTNNQKRALEAAAKYTLSDQELTAFKAVMNVHVARLRPRLEKCKLPITGAASLRVTDRRFRQAF
jgi:hypothetical protein